MSRSPDIVVAAFYKFTPLPDREAWQRRLQETCEQHGIRGTLLLAEEGINGTIAGSRAAINALRELLASDSRFDGTEYKESSAEEMPFHRLKIRLKNEIVTLGVENIDPTCTVGTYVPPTEWNALISDPDVLLVDTRNDYEVAIGRFRGAVDPQTESFRELPKWIEEQHILERKPKIAMYCTGGIRCEKSTAYLKSLGLDDVFHLQGGILKYLEEIPEEESLWEGACFVFDERVAVTHGLAKADYELCRACRRPLSPEDRHSPDHEAGVSCPHCVDKFTDEQRTGFRERWRQEQLARARGEKHVGNVQYSSLHDETFHGRRNK